MVQTDEKIWLNKWRQTDCHTAGKAGQGLWQRPSSHQKGFELHKVIEYE